MSQVTCGKPEFKVGLHKRDAQEQPLIYDIQCFEHHTLRCKNIIFSNKGLNQTSQ